MIDAKQAYKLLIEHKKACEKIIANPKNEKQEIDARVLLAQIEKQLSDIKGYFF